MILLDTCALLFDALSDARLSQRAGTAIEQADQGGRLYLADITFWEVAMLVDRGRLTLDVPPTEFFDSYLCLRQVKVLPITAEIATRSMRFGTEVNNDPADRLIAATAVEHGARLVTSDRNLRAASMIDTLW